MIIVVVVIVICWIVFLLLIIQEGTKTWSSGGRWCSSSSSSVLVCYPVSSSYAYPCATIMIIIFNRMTLGSTNINCGCTHLLGCTTWSRSTTDTITTTTSCLHPSYSCCGSSTNSPSMSCLLFIQINKHIGILTHVWFTFGNTTYLLT